MLLKNGEKYTLTAEDKETIKKLTGGKFPVMFRYVDSMYSINPLNNNRREFPRSITLPTITPVVDAKTKDTSFLQYYENSVFKADGSGKRIEEFFPTHINLKERIVVNDTQKDLFWFLWNNQLNASGPSAKQAKKHYFHLENLEKEAESFVTEKGLELSVGFAIMNEDGLSEEKLRTVAASYFISNAEDESLPVLRKMLYNIIMAPEKRTGKPNPATLKKFNNDTKSEKGLQLKSKIQKAVDLGIIKYKNDKKKWYWVDNEGNPTTTICTAPNAMKSREELFEYLNLKDKAKEAKEFIDEVEKAHKSMKEAAV